MKKSDTPIYDETLKATGCDLKAIVERPAWSIKRALARAEQKPRRKPAA